MKGQTSLEPVLDMTESINIKDLAKVEEKPAKNVENKYSRSGKAKVEVKGDLSKNLNAGKNAYDVDDPLNGKSALIQSLPSRTNVYYRSRRSPNLIFEYPPMVILHWISLIHPLIDYLNNEHA